MAASRLPDTSTAAARLKAVTRSRKSQPITAIGRQPVRSRSRWIAPVTVSSPAPATRSPSRGQVSSDAACSQPLLRLLRARWSGPRTDTPAPPGRHGPPEAGPGAGISGSGRPAAPRPSWQRRDWHCPLRRTSLTSPAAARPRAVAAWARRGAAGRGALRVTGWLPFRWCRPSAFSGAPDPRHLALARRLAAASPPADGPSRQRGPPREHVA
jgi:hypothetical protein